MADKYEAQMKASCSLSPAVTGKQNINMVFISLFTYLSVSSYYQYLPSMCI